MVRGPSGRIVVELDPELKVELYTELARRSLTLKAWIEGEAELLLGIPDRGNECVSRGGNKSTQHNVRKGKDSND